MPFIRQHLLSWIALLGMHAQASAADLPLSGPAVPGMESADRAYSSFMQRHHIPGGSAAIMKDGKILYARGFGYTDREKKSPVQPDTLFRIASISKPITALAVVSLVEQKRLAYQTKVFPCLGYPTPDYKGAKRDPRLDSITVEHLLQHSGGWDRDASFDPMFRTNQATRDLTGSEQPPATAEQIAHWMVGKPLQFDPGTRYAYSNYGYCILGRMIEKATGQSYETYTRAMLAKAGITTMRIGGGRRNELLPNETRYYDYLGAKHRSSAWNEPDTPGPYRFPIPTLDAHGGWIASASDLLRFTTLLDGRPEPADLINNESIALTHKRPSFAPPAAEKHNYYGYGWSFWERKDGTFRNWFHSGSLPGTMSMLIRSDNGITWAALFNLRPKDHKAASKDLDQTMWQAVRGVTKWP
jgi:N-acyl-D-amino-acid deacylase